MCLLLGVLSVTGGYSRSEGSVSCESCDGGGGRGGGVLRWARRVVATGLWTAIRLTRRRSASSSSVSLNPPPNSFLHPWTFSSSCYLETGKKKKMTKKRRRKTLQPTWVMSALVYLSDVSLRLRSISVHPKWTAVSRAAALALSNYSWWVTAQPALAVTPAAGRICSKATCR